MANWLEMIREEAKERLDPMEQFTCSSPEEEMAREFDDGYGSGQGAPFHAWTAQRVYFAVVYDGAEWVGSVPRNPCSEETQHHGGQ